MFFLMKGETVIKKFNGTTNAGIKGLKKFDTYNSLGVAVLKQVGRVLRDEEVDASPVGLDSVGFLVWLPIEAVSIFQAALTLF